MTLTPIGRIVSKGADVSYDRCIPHKEDLYHNETYTLHPEPLKRLLHRVHIATMTELKQALGTSSDATVRKQV